jgi:hypothetical protein
MLIKESGQDVYVELVFLLSGPKYLVHNFLCHFVSKTELRLFHETRPLVPILYLVLRRTEWGM